ncbi:MAG: lysophospholipid acyltransferase family protein [Thermoflexales bacterium]|nr:lysophospholipid acyltransferase family protein [Thermoflexales bacterium]MCS7324922.1 lysophospholipid acyltransferase family protein [Thermoflexales bacterium]MCX7940005.1 lysophospholipid acyltransferase family protein [Thermoflexales bacterium]MDW8054317.1 lysophospholipid acyltransferase family protein [Anaerolineae bacterium]MDW8291521.1 lysophospholipid acyltransferase family protein [Anaerolineae bacterium]
MTEHTREARPRVLTARKHPVLNALIYRLLVRTALQSSFHAVLLLQRAPLPPDDVPLILYGNHSSWWDAYVPMALNEERWQRDGYVMVEETQLARYQFFRFCGGFSVDRHDLRKAMESLRYAVELLSSGTRRMLLIFPQGEIRANDQRPLGFHTGAARIALHVAEQRGQCWLYPMALRYEFIGEQKPYAFIRIAEPIRVHASEGYNARALTACMEQALTQTLDALREDVIAYRFADYERLLSGMWSINRLWDAIRGKPQIRRVGGI